MLELVSVERPSQAEFEQVLASLTHGDGGKVAYGGNSNYKRIDVTNPGPTRHGRQSAIDKSGTILIDFAARHVVVLVQRPIECLIVTMTYTAADTAKNLSNSFVGVANKWRVIGRALDFANSSD